jgi:hypothetical protein
VFVVLLLLRRYFIDENSMKDHFKTKLHKKRCASSHTRTHALARSHTHTLAYMQSWCASPPSWEARTEAGTV